MSDTRPELDGVGLEAIRAHVRTHGRDDECPNALRMLRRLLALFDLMTDPEWQAAVESEEVTTAELREQITSFTQVKEDQ